MCVLKRILGSAVFLFPLIVTASVPALQGCGGDGGDNCCRVCDTGKACGDACIAKTDSCNKSGGCACNK